MPQSTRSHSPRGAALNPAPRIRLPVSPPPPPDPHLRYSGCFCLHPRPRRGWPGSSGTLSQLRPAGGAHAARLGPRSGAAGGGAVASRWVTGSEPQRPHQEAGGIGHPRPTVSVVPKFLSERSLDSSSTPHGSWGPPTPTLSPAGAELLGKRNGFSWWWPGRLDSGLPGLRSHTAWGAPPGTGGAAGDRGRRRGRGTAAGETPWAGRRCWGGAVGGALCWGGAVGGALCWGPPWAGRCWGHTC